MNIRLGIPKYATVQMVGNKADGEGITFATEVEDLSLAVDFLTILVKNVFKFEVLSQFDCIDSLVLNPTYRFIKAIFEKEDEFVKQSNNLARHLYDQSIHPNIKNGEFYVIYLTDCGINDDSVDGILLLKTEIKDKFLTVANENGNLSIVPQVGISTKHIDKGCFILNTKPDDGYILSIVDTSTIRMDGLYWTNNFLYAKKLVNDFQLTRDITSFCSSAIHQIAKQYPEKTVELAKAARNVALMLQNDGVMVNTSEMLSALSVDAEIANQLSNYRRDYENRNGEISDSFLCVSNAAKRKAITKANLIKLGSDFEVKILDPSTDIEQGYDKEKRKNYIKLYYR